MIELRPAYVWDCDECGRENFCRGLIPEFDEAEYEELRDEHGVQPWEAGAFVMMPTEVTCKFCDAKFSTAAGENDE